MTDNLLSWRLENILLIAGVVILLALLWNLIGHGVGYFRQQSTVSTVANAAQGAAGFPTAMAA